MENCARHDTDLRLDRKCNITILCVMYEKEAHQKLSDSITFFGQVSVSRILSCAPSPAHKFVGTSDTNRFLGKVEL